RAEPEGSGARVRAQSSGRRAPALRSDRRGGRAVNRSQRLQRLAVRMLYDEGFRARVLSGEEVVDAEDGALVRAVDPRAWSTDPLRAVRTLTAIVTELPVTGALLGASRALQFFR